MSDETKKDAPPPRRTRGEKLAALRGEKPRKKEGKTRVPRGKPPKKKTDEGSSPVFDMRDLLETIKKAEADNVHATRWLPEAEARGYKVRERAGGSEVLGVGDGVLRFGIDDRVTYTFPNGKGGHLTLELDPDTISSWEELVEALTADDYDPEGDTPPRTHRGIARMQLGHIG